MYTEPGIVVPDVCLETGAAEYALVLSIPDMTYMTNTSRKREKRPPRIRLNPPLDMDISTIKTQRRAVSLRKLSSRSAHVKDGAFYHCLSCWRCMCSRVVPERRGLGMSQETASNAKCFMCAASTAVVADASDETLIATSKRAASLAIYRCTGDIAVGLHHIGSCRRATCLG